MILITKRQARAFGALWQATDHGAHPWQGVVKVDGMAQENVGDCLHALRRKGALDWAMTIPRTYRLLIGIEELNVQERKVVQAGGGDFAIARNGIRDSGAFMDAVKRARLDPPETLKLKTPTLYTKGRPDPNARAL